MKGLYGHTRSNPAWVSIGMETNMDLVISVIKTK